MINGIILATGLVVAEMIPYLMCRNTRYAPTSLGAWLSQPFIVHSDCTPSLSVLGFKHRRVHRRHGDHAHLGEGEMVVVHCGSALDGLLVAGCLGCIHCRDDWMSGTSEQAVAPYRCQPRGRGWQRPVNGGVKMQNR